ncbi:MAG: hypothetical protein J5706_07660, partial [Elusimicrobiales bacterium]|nr:hypothetical protein [Elusimicrobiales bacterium]
RANLLFTFLENFDYVFHLPPPPSDILAEYAEIISYNIWQMDGLKFVIPQTCHSEIITEGDLFEQKTVIKECPGCKHKDPQRHNGIYCKIMDWEKNEFFKFADMLKGSKLRV